RSAMRARTQRPTGSRAAAPIRARRNTSSSGGSPGLRRPDPGDQLLLVIAGVLAGRVVGLDRRRVGKPAAGVDTEVVADEARRTATAVVTRGRELWIPGVLRQADVVPERTQICAVELDRGVDAVVPAGERCLRVEEQTC